ncbi:MAG: hypothetical protein GY801_43700 [bacterium]|nr:hypothetical protein [bacterium]
MEPLANRLIELLNIHSPAFERSQPLQEHVRRAVRMALPCHTSALGGHVERCPGGHIERIFYNSCDHRVCPRCAGRTRRSRLINQRAKLLPVRHAHVVFTLPHAVNPLWRRNPQVMGICSSTAPPTPCGSCWGMSADWGRNRASPSPWKPFDRLRTPPGTTASNFIPICTVW